jgi:hypothetical protein
MGGTCGTNGIKELHRFLGDKFEENRPVVKSRPRQEDNIEIYLK